MNPHRRIPWMLRASMLLIPVSAGLVAQSNPIPNQPGTSDELIKLFIYGDAEESQGIEVDASYNPQPNWQIIFGYAHATKAETVASTTPARLGLPLGAFPKDMVTLWTRYDVRSGPLARFAFGGGVRSSSSAVFVGDQNLTARMPAYTTVDLLMQYKFKLSEREAQLQLNVKNALDEEYREGNFGGWGDPRSYLISLGMKF